MIGGAKSNIFPSFSISSLKKSFIIFNLWWVSLEESS
jgi:hypothetical protein